MVTEVQRRHVVFDDDRDLLGQAADRKAPVHLAQDPAEDDARRLSLAEERDLDVDRLVQLDLDEVGMQRLAGHGVYRVFAEQHRELLVLDGELDHGVLPVRALQNVGETARRHRQRHGRQLFSISNGGNAAVAAKAPSRSFARLASQVGVELDDVHERSPKVRGEGALAAVPFWQGGFLALLCQFFANTHHDSVKFSLPRSSRWQYSHLALDRTGDSACAPMR